jgi:transposase
MTVKYIGLDVHQATTVAAVRDEHGKLVMECILETKASTLLEFVRGLRGELHVTLEEGSWAAWLHDVLEPHVHRLLVCDPRKNTAMRQGNQNDKIDAPKLSELLRADLLSPVYHGESGVRLLRELVRSYLTLTEDTTRVMNRIQAVYRGRGIACGSSKIYSNYASRVCVVGPSDCTSNSINCSRCGWKRAARCCRRAVGIQRAVVYSRFPTWVRSVPRC